MERKVAGSTRPEHLMRHGWNKNFYFEWPEDVNLAITQEVPLSEIPNQFIEIYHRFLKLDFIEKFGSHCILMSHLLRRILRYHGFNAYARQYVLHWEKPAKGQTLMIGGFDNMAENEQIDAHMAVAVNGFILDFSSTPVYQQFGATAPKAFIGLDNPKYHYEYQNFGEFGGNACWTPAMPLNPIIRHWRYKQKQLEIELSKKYFDVYQF